MTNGFDDGRAGIGVDRAGASHEGLNRLLAEGEVAEYQSARGDVPGRDWALCEYRDSGHPYDPPVYVSMVRRGTHKLVVHHGPPATNRGRSGELFDLDRDPHELENLWDRAEARARRTELQETLLDVLVATEDRSQPREAYW